MIKQVNVTKTLNVPAEAAWAAISGIGGLDLWFPIIASCRVEGQGAGAVRYLGLKDGGIIKDVIEEINHEDKRFRYLRTESPFPVNRYTGLVTVSDAGGQSAISWTVEIDIDEPSDDLTDFINRALSDGIDGIERALRREEK